MDAYCAAKSYASFLSVFIAYILSLSFFCTRYTLPKEPLPITLRILKSYLFIEEEKCSEFPDLVDDSVSESLIPLPELMPVLYLVLPSIKRLV